MTEENMELPADEPPKSGEWVDSEALIAAPTQEEMDEGQRLGESIDTDDDEDSGDGQS
jgi:hypothetical protein